MATSLAEQLRKLAVPQVLPLIHEKKRASLLFDPKEAASFDRDTIFELGIDGLQELKNLDPTFSEFENTIFSVLSKSIERSVLTQENNDKLSNNIQKYLIKLSPYFLLKPAHKTIEWLITRFHIHQYNVDDLLMLCFPYHDTRMFVKVIQLFNLKDPAGKWHWLQVLQKPGVPLSKTALLNHCASNSGFMSFVCDMTLKAVKVHKDKSHVLATLFAFTCTTLMGALEHSKSVSEAHIMHIVKFLLKGLDSPIADFSAGAFMIVAQLTRKCQLSEKLLTSFITKISKNPVPTLNCEVVLLLTQIYQSQESLESFPVTALLKIVKRKGFESILGQLSMSGANVIPLLNCILSQSLRCMMENEKLLPILKDFISGLLTNIIFENEGVEVVIQSIIQTFETHADSSNENAFKSFSEVLNALEKQYPSKFDSAIRKILKNSGTSSKCKKLFNFIPNTILREKSTTLFEKINDPNEYRRIAGIKFLASKTTDIKETDKELLIDSLQSRIADDCPEVIFAVLDSFSIDLLLDLLGQEVLLKNLFQISQKCCSSKDKLENLATLTASILCSEPVVKAAPNEFYIFITILPFLIPTHSSQVGIAQNILSSYFGEKNKFLTSLNAEENNIRYKDLSSNTFKHLCEGNNIPTLTEVKEALSKLMPENLSTTEKFLSIILLTSSLKDNATVEECQIVLDFALKYIEDLKVIVINEVFLTQDNIQKCLQRAQRHELPLEGFSYCISVLINKTSLPPTLVDNLWWDLKHVRDDAKVVESAKLITKLFDIILKGCSLDKKDTKLVFIELLKIFFKKYFPDHQSHFRFLCNFWIGHELLDIIEPHSSSVSYELQLRSLCFATSLLRQSDKSTSWMLERNEIIVPALLVSLMCPLSQIRDAALDCLSILGLSIASAISQTSYIQLLDELLCRREELLLDSEQLPVIMYILFSDNSVVRSLVKSNNIPHMNGILESLVNCVVNVNTPSYISAALLRILSNVSSKNVLQKIIPLGHKIIQEYEKDKKEFDQYSSEILRNIISRLTDNTNDFLNHKQGLALLETLLLSKHILTGDRDGKELYAACLVLNQISKDIFESISQQQRQHLLSILIEVGTDNDCPEIVSAVGQVWKRIILDSKLIVVELEKMRDAKQVTSPGNAGHSLRKSRRILHAAPSVELLKSVPWKRGVTLLEFVQNKKKLNDVQFLVPILFHILNRCLEFEQQAPVEYIKQLLLSCILHCCQKLSPDGSPLKQTINFKDEMLNVGLVVQCVRGTQNPQTHHHALLLLSHLAGMIPDQVLHNIMAIFTFMGSSILRHDDAYSFQVISKLVETIIPVLIEAGASGSLSKKMNSKLEDVIAKVMRVFVDAMLDIPEHRRVPLFYKLLVTLDAEKYLWLFLCLVLENHVLKGSEGVENKNVGKKSVEMPKRLEFLMTIINTFGPPIIMRNCIQVVSYLRSLPAQKETSLTQKKKSANKYALFDIENNTDKQLRHFKYTLVTFLSSLLSSTNFITEVAKLKEEEIMEMETLYRKMIEDILFLIQSVSREADLNAGKLSAKYWKVMLNQCYDILDKVNALLPSTMFLVVIQGLTESNIPTIRRKALELLNTRLQYQSSFYTSCQPENLLSILPSLLTIVKDISSEGSSAPETEVIQQTALLSLKLLARVLAQDYPKEFKKILELVTDLITSNLPDGTILASVLLCIAELCSTLRANAIGYLPKIMPSVIKVLKVQNRIASSDIVLLGVVTAVQKIIENLSNFLSPYMDKLLLGICGISAKWQSEPENSKVTPIVQKLKAIRQKLSTVPSRVLVPSVSKCYSQILNKGAFPSLGPLMSILGDSFSEMSAQELVQMMPDLTNFFQTALQLRSNNRLEKEELCEAEEHVVLALVSLVLKLSESSFRPLYYNIYHWATSVDVHKERAITFYRLSSCIAERLKGLFVLFAGHFIKHAASMLDQNNIVKSESLYFGSDEESKNKSMYLLEYVLKTLYNVFLYDGQSFVNGDRFETLMQPIVDQLENTLGGEEALQARVKSTVTPCIVQLAVAAGDDILWKQLNYQVLLKARNNSPVIRLASLETLCEMAKKLGEDFLPLLPETIQFLAELLEDENEMVEKASQKAIRELGEALGEPLKKYF